MVRLPERKPAYRENSLMKLHIEIMKEIRRNKRHSKDPFGQAGQRSERHSRDSYEQAGQLSKSIVRTGSRSCSRGKNAGSGDILQLSSFTGLRPPFSPLPPGSCHPPRNAYH